MSQAQVSKNLTKLTAQFLTFLKHSRSFESALKTGRVVSVEPGKVCFEIDVKEEHANGAGQMHGAFSALLIDNLTGAAMSTTGKLLRPDNPFFSGVSVALNLSYLRSAKVGDTIVAKAEVLKMGRNLAFTTCELSNKSDGKIVATGQHTKFVGAAASDSG